MRNPLRSAGHPALSLTSEYALRAVLALARANGRGLKATEIADLTGTPRNYMSKTLNALAKEGIVRSRRGPTGGFALARPAEAISVAQIARTFCEERAPARCLLADRACNPEAPCAAHHRWAAVISATQAPLDVTIAELLEESGTAE